MWIYPPSWVLFLLAVLVVVGVLAVVAYLEARNAWPKCPECGARGAALVDRDLYKCRHGHRFVASPGAERCRVCNGPLAETTHGHRCRQCRMGHAVT